MKLAIRVRLILALILLLTGCGEQISSAIDKAGEALSPASTAVAGATQPQETDWQETAPGVAWRRMAAGTLGSVVVARVDPAAVRIRVAYDWQSPGTVGEWAAALKPLLLVNGGYFDKQGRATALVINDGVVQGSSYEGFGGMLAVDTEGRVSVRSLRDQPFDPSENLAQAFQASPVLLRPDGSIPEIEDNGGLARRTAVATDRQGRLLIIVCDQPRFSLTGLAQWLRDSGLEIDTALNLDGGSSTGIYISGSAPLEIESRVKVPLVLLVEKRN